MSLCTIQYVMARGKTYGNFINTKKNSIPFSDSMIRNNDSLFGIDVSALFYLFKILDDFLGYQCSKKEILVVSSISCCLFCE